MAHKSGHQYSIDMWEVLNEVDSEHHTSVENYTLLYDAITSAIHAVSPHTKFMGTPRVCALVGWLCLHVCGMCCQRLCLRVCV